MAEETRIGDEEGDKEDHDERGDPGGDFEVAELEVRVSFVGLDGFHGEEGEYPYTVLG